MGSAMTRGKDESALDVREAQGGARFLWERQPDESVQAYARFLAYRDIDPTERSHRKVASICAISETLVNRWGKRWSWTKRATAYDMWVLELGDQLGKRAVLGHRGAAARFGSLALAKASRTVEKLDEAKLTAGEAIDLAVNGTKLARQALALADATGDTRADRTPVANVAISLGSTPPWLTAPITNARETEPKVVGLSGEQVLAGGNAAPVRRPEVKRLAEKIVKSPRSTK